MWRLRCLLSICLLAIGLVSGVISEWMSYGEGELEVAFQFLPPSIQGHVLDMIRCTMFLVRLICLSLAPLADDARFTRCVLAINALISLYPAWAYRRRLTCYSREVEPSCPKVSCTLGLLFYLGLRGFDLIFLAGTVRAMCYRTPGRIQTLMWKLVSIWILGSCILVRTYYSIAVAASCHVVSSEWCWVLGGSIALGVVRQPELRQNLQARCLKVLEGRKATASAAGIAALVGRRSAKDALAMAKARFRHIGLSQLTIEDLANNAPDPALFLRSSSARLGECDAFVSHSWHDDADAKWAALQAWRLNFVEREGREPRVWFDKCCIDQANIETDLSCLPLFLCGCSKLLVLCGKTYLSRLWCIVEVFSYVHMGGKLEDIDISPVLNSAHEEEERRLIEDSFCSFDVHRCDCHNAEDKEMMLTAINAAFGSTSRFNSTVQLILQQLNLTASGDTTLESSQSTTQNTKVEPAPYGSSQERCDFDLAPWLDACDWSWSASVDSQFTVL